MEDLALGYNRRQRSSEDRELWEDGMSTSLLIPALIAALGLAFAGLVIGAVWALTTRTGEARSRLLVRCLVGFGLWAAMAVAGAIGLFGSATGTAGRPAPDFEFHPIGGDRQRLSDLRGKPVVINFFATWCPPCMRELPELDRELAREFSDRGVMLLVVGIGESEDTLSRLKRAKGFAFTMAPDPDEAIFAKYRQRGIPCTYLIDADGKIARQIIGYDPREIAALKSQIAGLLKAPE